jgi:hypothetical protein
MHVMHVSNFEPPFVEAAAPVWPLELTDRRAGFDSADASAVYDATEIGSHAAELASWTHLSGTTPP